LNSQVDRQRVFAQLQADVADTRFAGWLVSRNDGYGTAAEQVELLSLIGDVVEKEGEPLVHAHAVVGKRDGTAHGGHLLQARVRPTCELVLTESPAHLRKEFDPVVGVALIKL